MKNRLILVFVVALTVGAIVWRFYWQAPAEKGSGAPMVSVTVPELNNKAQAGETAFNENCASCHGANAAGQEGVAPPLVHIIYEPNHHGDQSFYLAASRGVRAHHWRFGDMPPVEGITDSEVSEIIAYVRTLQRANGIN